MNDEFHPNSIDEELSARLTALALGEASDFERAQLQDLMTQRPELAARYRQLQQMHEWLTEIGATASSANEFSTSSFSTADENWKLPSARRELVESVIEGKTLNPAVASVQIEPQRESTQRPWYVSTFLLTAASAACLLLCIKLVFVAQRVQLTADNAIVAGTPLSLESTLAQTDRYQYAPLSTAEPDFGRSGNGRADEYDQSATWSRPAKPALNAIRDALSNNTTSNETSLGLQVQVPEDKAEGSFGGSGGSLGSGGFGGGSRLSGGIGGNIDGPKVADPAKLGDGVVSNPQSQGWAGSQSSKWFDSAPNRYFAAPAPVAAPAPAAASAPATASAPVAAAPDLAGAVPAPAAGPVPVPATPIVPESLDRLSDVNEPQVALKRNEQLNQLYRQNAVGEKKLADRLEALPGSEGRKESSLRGRISAGRELQRGTERALPEQPKADPKPASGKPEEIAGKSIRSRKDVAVDAWEESSSALHSDLDSTRSLEKLRMLAKPQSPALANSPKNHWSINDQALFGNRSIVVLNDGEARDKDSDGIPPQEIQNDFVTEGFGVNKGYFFLPPIVASSGPQVEYKKGLEKELTKRKMATVESLQETSAATEAFSTFSLHVSDVSFKLALASLLQGEWPDAANVRLEEFVNAFDYHDPLPSREEHVACRVEQAIHPFLMQRNVLRVSMRTAVSGRDQNTPLRLTLLLDNSGSMERPDRQQTVRRAMETLTQQLGAADQMTLISFSNTPRLLADQVNGSNAASLLNLVADLPSEGGTNIEAALQLASEKAHEQMAPGTQNRVILLTDGAVNLGNANPESLAKTVTKLRDSGIAFDAAGISAQDLNDELLEALTRQGDGRYYLLDSAESASDGFANQIAGALQPSAKNVKVQVEFNPERVGRYKLLGFEKHMLKQEDFHNDQVDAAELAAAEAGVALYQFEVKPDGQGDIGSVSVRFQDVETGRMVERRWPILYDPTAPRIEQASPSLRIATAAAMLAAKLQGGPLGDSVDFKSLAAMITNLPESQSPSERLEQLRTMIDRARQLRGE